MLQIVTKMYFREGVPLHSTIHREVLFTNTTSLRAEVIELPVGEVATSDSFGSVSTATLSVTEHLEAEDPDGGASVLVATAGLDLIDDLADVLSFKLDAVFSRDLDLVRRLVAPATDRPSSLSGTRHFRKTFEAGRYVDEAQWDSVRSFMDQLLALERPHYERAMRAIRRVARATQRAADDPTLAYVDLVTALESLSEGATAPPASWERVDPRVRRIVGAALEGADEDLANRVRQAVAEAERAGAKSRFVAFCLNHVAPAYFREEAANAVRPLAGAELERALKTAYDIRSRSVHVLEDLPPEAWALGDGADTASPPGLGVILSLEGLARLARHVVVNYVARAPKGVDRDFNWRASLPGQLRMQLAPQYWLWQADGFAHETVERYFTGFVEHLAEKASGGDEPVADMRGVVERIEVMLPGTADGPAKTMMVAIYVLWHQLMAPEYHRPDAERALAAHRGVLKEPSLPAFAVALLLGQLPEWNADSWADLADERRAARARPSQIELPARFDAALQALAAVQALEEDREEKAKELIARAVEDSPGNEQLIAWEADLVAGQSHELDLGSLLFPVLRASEEAAPAGDQTETEENEGT